MIATITSATVSTVSSVTSVTTVSTTTTASAVVSSVTSATAVAAINLSLALGASLILTLLVLLIQKEILTASDGPRARALSKILNVPIVPMLMCFVMIAAVNVLHTLAMH
jgi:hypothetical protein